MMSKRYIVGVLIILGLVAAYALWPKPKEHRVDANADIAAIHQAAGEQEFVAPRAMTGKRIAAGLFLVEGVVVDAVTGQGVGGVDVAMLGAAGETTVTSGGDGAFEVSLLPGVYTISAYGDGVVGLGAPPLSVGAAIPTLRVQVVGLAEVHGKVIDASGASVSNAEIVATSTLGSHKLLPEDLGSAGITNSSGDGSFSLSIAPGEVELAATKGQQAGSAWLSGVAPGTVVNDVVIRVAAGVSVAGRVENDRGISLAGANIQLTVYVENKYEQFVATADSAGAFAFDGIPPGKLIIEAWLDGHGATGEATYVTLAEGESKTDVTLVVQGPFVISGVVVDGKGQPRSGARVAAMSATSRRRREWIETSSDGKFSFGDLGPGPHNVFAGKSGYPDVEKTVSAPGTVELQLVRGGAIVGTVVNTEGESVPSFTVRVERFVSSLDGRHKRMRGSGEATGSSGSFVLEVNHPGSYEVVIIAPGYGSERRSGVQVPVDGDAKLQVRLAKSGVILGKVSSKGKPVPGARVSILEGYLGPPVFSDSDGAYRLTGVTPGTRMLSISKQGFTTKFVEGIDVKPASEAQANAELADETISERVGIGVEWSEMAGHPVVFGTKSGSGARKAGLVRDDIVRGIDGISTYGMSRTAARELVRGRAGTLVRLDIERAGKRSVVMVKRG